MTKVSDTGTSNRIREILPSGNNPDKTGQNTPNITERDHLKHDGDANYWKTRYLLLEQKIKRRSDVDRVAIDVVAAVIDAARRSIGDVYDPLTIAAKFDLKDAIAAYDEATTSACFKGVADRIEAEREDI